jgi:hypothetical protein
MLGLPLIYPLMAATGSLPHALLQPIFRTHISSTSSSFAPATTNLPYDNFVKCTPLYHGHPGHALFAYLVMSRDERHMMFDCPTLATARLQYHVVFGAHVEMKAAFTNPLIAAPLASFVHNHVTTAP